MIRVGKLPMQASFRDTVRCIIRSVEINFIFQKYTLPEEWPYQVIVTANATLFVLVGVGLGGFRENFIVGPLQVLVMIS